MDDSKIAVDSRRVSGIQSDLMFCHANATASDAIMTMLCVLVKDRI